MRNRFISALFAMLMLGIVGFAGGSPARAGIDGGKAISMSIDAEDCPNAPDLSKGLPKINVAGVGLVEAPIEVCTGEVATPDMYGGIALDVEPRGVSTMDTGDNYLHYCLSSGTCAHPFVTRPAYVDTGYWANYPHGFRTGAWTERAGYVRVHCRIADRNNGWDPVLAINNTTTGQEKGWFIPRDGTMWYFKSASHYPPGEWWHDHHLHLKYEGVGPWYDRNAKFDNCGMRSVAA